MRKIILDIEGNNLYPQVTVLHCAVATDLQTNETFTFRPKQMIDGTFTKFLDECDFIACHYGTGFDFPAMEKVLGWTPAKEEYLFDTLVYSRILNPDRSTPRGAKSAHSVEAWGVRLGVPKPKYEQWETFDEEMMYRCNQDTYIQTAMYRMLNTEAGFNESFFDPRNPEGYKPNEPNWSESITQEHMSSYIMFQQQMNGCNFEYEKALEYVHTLEMFAEEKAEYILRNIPQSCSQKGVTISEPFKKNGEYKKTVLDWYGEEATVSGPFSRIEWHTLNLNSPLQLKEWLYTIGWVPDEWNYKKDPRGREIKDESGEKIKTSPKISQSSLDLLDGYLGECISYRNKANHKKNQIAGLIRRTPTDTMRVPAGANPIGTPTRRMKHSGVANIPKATSNKEGSLVWFPGKQNPFFGTEMRSLFSAPEGKVLVGRDAAGLEFRVFAHYVNNQTLIDTVLGGDIHSYNQEMAGLPTRDKAKTFIYAFLFGAGDWKMGDIVDPTASDEMKKILGKEAKDKFLKAIPGLGELIKGVKKASQRGWLKTLDGGCLRMRRGDNGRIAENKALNVLCQGGGAIVMTYARIWVWKEIEKRGWIASGKALKVLDYHDEETWECDIDISEEVAELLVRSIVEAGIYYNMNIPLDANAQIGKTWAEIH